jgi:hypothetical protein
MERKNKEIIQEYSLELDAKERYTNVIEGERRYGCVPEYTRSALAIGCMFVSIIIISFVAPAKKRYAPVNTSITSLILSLFFFVVVSNVLIWSYDRQNRNRILML